MGDEIDQIIKEAREKYVYKRCERRGHFLRRPCHVDDSVERLVNGRWIPWRRWSSRRESWKELGPDELRVHVRMYLVAELDAPTAGWRERFGDRLEFTAIGRLVKPPLPGGAARLSSPAAARRAVQDHGTKLDNVGAKRCEVLAEQAYAGYRDEGERLEVLEQRANLFLGAAGITATLVLAAAGILLGSTTTRSLQAPWLELAAVALALVSISAVFATLRAAQAAMTSFARWPPNGFNQISDRFEAESVKEIHHTYLCALLVSAERYRIVGNWKLERLRGARYWFTGAVVGVAGLAILILLDVLINGS